MQNSSTKKIKIGISNNPKERLRSLRGELKITIFLLGVMDGDYAEERKLHTQFNHLKSHGEWFYGGPDLLELIDNLQPVTYNIPFMTRHGPRSVEIQAASGVVSTRQQDEASTTIQVIITKCLIGYDIGLVEYCSVPTINNVREAISEALKTQDLTWYGQNGAAIRLLQLKKTQSSK